jgi:hypothetical protein
MSRASGLRRVQIFPQSFPAGPRPHRKIRSPPEESLHATVGCYSLEVSAALLINCLIVGLPSVAAKGDADDAT